MSKITRRRFAVALLLISSLSLSACGANETPATGAEAPGTRIGVPTATPSANEGSTSTFTFDPSTYKKNEIEPGAHLRVSSWGDTSEQKVVSDALARFNLVYPEVKITYEPQPSDYATKLIAQIRSNSQPDVFYLDVDLPYQLIPNNVLLDLTPALAEVGRSKDDYFPSLTEVYLGAGGEIYGLPKDFNSMALFYNTDLVKTAPESDWTQDDFAAWVKENTTGSGQTQVFGLATDLIFSLYWGNFAIANGARVLENGKCAINGPEAVATLDWFYSMYRDQHLTISSDVGATWEGEAFARKRAASIVVGGWVNPYLTDPKADFDINYDAVPLPVGKTGARTTVMAFAGWGASAKSQYPRAAAALVLFLTGRENQGAILQTGFALPSLKGFDDDPFFKGPSTLSRISRILYEGANYGTSFVWGGEANPKIQRALNEATERVFARMQASQEALDQACQEIDEALAGH